MNGETHVLTLDMSSATVEFSEVRYCGGEGDRTPGNTDRKPVTAPSHPHNNELPILEPFALHSGLT